MIKNDIRSRLEKGKVESAIKLFQLVTHHPESVNSMSSYLSRLKKSEDDYYLALEITEVHQANRQKIATGFINEITSLPDDLELLKRKLKTILHDYSIIPDTVDLIKYLLSEEYSKNALDSLSNELSNSQEYEDSELETSWEKNVGRIKPAIDEIIHKISADQLYIDWATKFIYWLENNQYKYFAISPQTENQEHLSSYYPVINEIQKNDINYKIKGTLFNWLEKYLVGEFDKAYNLLIDARDQKGIGNPLFYEFLAAAFVNQPSFEAKIRSVLITGDLRELKRVLFYVERINGANSIDAGIRTTTYICEKIAGVIKKVYSNVAHNYFKDGTPKGRSKQREVIKRCIDTFFQVHRVKGNLDFGDNFSSLISVFLLELDNAGKFPWIDLKSDSLINKTAFDAVNLRLDLELILPVKGDYIEALLTEIKIKISELQKNRKLEEKICERFLRCCMIAYFNYQDDRFIDIARDLSQGKKVKLDLNTVSPDSSDFRSEYELEKFLHRIGVPTYEVSNELIDDNISILRITEALTQLWKQESKNKATVYPTKGVQQDKLNEPDKYPHYSTRKERPLNIMSTDLYRSPVDYVAKLIALSISVIFNLLILSSFNLEYLPFFPAFVSVVITNAICIYLSIKAND